MHDKYNILLFLVTTCKNKIFSSFIIEDKEKCSNYSILQKKKQSFWHHLVMISKFLLGIPKSNMITLASLDMKMHFFIFYSPHILKFIHYDS